MHEAIERYIYVVLFVVVDFSFCNVVQFVFFGCLFVVVVLFTIISF